MTQEHRINLDKVIELYKSKVAFYESQNTRGEYAVTVRELKYVVETLEALRSEISQGDLISREALKEAFKIEELYWGKRIIDIIDNATTVEPEPISEIQKKALKVVQNLTKENSINFNERRFLREAILSESKRPQGEWIPVSERLPQNRDWYLGIFREVDTGWINPVPYICDYVGKETIGTTKAGWILKNITDEKYCAEYYKNLECICWQPLPVKPNIPNLGGDEEE